MDLNNVLRSAVELRETLRVDKQISIIKDVVKEECLYPQRERKSSTVRIIENLLWYLKHGEACRYYNSYGFDIIGWRNQKDYLPYRRFRIERNKENYSVRPFHTYENRTCILRDKVLFSAYYGKMLGEKYVIKDYGLIKADGRVIDLQSHEAKTIDELITRANADVFVKKLFGECGDGCYLFRAGEKVSEELYDTMRGAEYLVQENLKQHDALNTINPSCVNTVRLVTIMGKHDRNPHILSHMLRLGIDAINDNRATGGLAVGISDDGILAADGIGHNAVMQMHPVTGVIFKGLQLPYWNEVKELAIKAHSFFPNVGSIGWDIAITPSGPVLLEGNDNWEICGPQDTAGGLKEKWYDLHNL